MLMSTLSRFRSSWNRHCV